MIKYCFITDEEKGLVQLGAGCPDEYYIEIGMQQRDVEQSEKDYQWYLTEKCPHYTEDEKTEIRKNNFLSEFFKLTYNETEVYYRRSPKGYTSAIESINTAFNIVNTLGSLPANILIFYEEPDFTKEEECTEEWLIEHQIKNTEMSLAEFTQFYTNFITIWNTEEH